MYNAINCAFKLKATYILKGLIQSNIKKDIEVIHVLTNYLTNYSQKYSVSIGNKKKRYIQKSTLKYLSEQRTPNTSDSSL